MVEWWNREKIKLGRNSDEDCPDPAEYIRLRVANIRHVETETPNPKLRGILPTRHVIPIPTPHRVLPDKMFRNYTPLAKCETAKAKGEQGNKNKENLP